MTRLPLALLWAAVGGALPACLPGSPKAPTPPELQPMAADMAGASDPGTFVPDELLSARSYFERYLGACKPPKAESDPPCFSLQPTCAACHNVAAGGVGPGFLVSSAANGSDLYFSITGYPKFNFKVEPTLNLLFTKGLHEGPYLAGADPANPGCLAGAPDPRADQCGTVKEWLTREAKERRTVVFNPQFSPFYPKTDGTENKLDLKDIFPRGKGAPFAEAYFTFRATKLARGLELSNIKFFNIKQAALTTKEQRTINFVHPLFVVRKPDGTVLPDPVDNFASLDKTVRLFADDFDAAAPLDPPGNGSNLRPDRTGAYRNLTGGGILLPPGVITLSDWREGDALNLVFDKLELLPPVVGENPCTPAGLAKFKEIAPFLAKSYMPGNCGTNPNGCHTATDTAGSLNLARALFLNSTNPAEMTAFAQLCEQTKFYNQTGGMVHNADPAEERHRERFKYTEANCNAAGLPGSPKCIDRFKALVEEMKMIDP